MLTAYAINLLNICNSHFYDISKNMDFTIFFYSQIKSTEITSVISFNMIDRILFLVQTILLKQSLLNHLNTSTHLYHELKYNKIKNTMTVNIEKQLFYNYFPSHYISKPSSKIQHDLHNLKHFVHIVLRYLNHFAKLLNAAKSVASTISARKNEKIRQNNRPKKIQIPIDIMGSKYQHKSTTNVNIRKQLLKKSQTSILKLQIKF